MRFLDLFSIKQKLIATYVMLILASIGLGYISLYTISVNKNVAESVHEVLDGRYVRVKHTSEYITDLQLLLTDMTKGTASANSVRESKSLADNLKYAAGKLQTSRYPEEIGAVKESSEHYLAQYASFVDMYKNGNLEEAKKLLKNDMYDNFMVVRKNLDRVSSNQIKVTNSAVDRITSKTPLIAAVIIILFEIISAVFILTQMPRLIASSIRFAIKNANALAHGELHTEIRIKRHDEFLPLLLAMEKMRVFWHDNIMLIKEVSNNISKSMSTLQDSSAHIDETAQDNQAYSSTVSQSAESMVENAGEIAKSCASASKQAADTSKDTQLGINRVNETIEKLNNQAKKSKEDAMLVAQLSDRAQKIGVIVNTIDDIASQTNLLALNAAIEAARAGEAGKGFAVVADEVRALASRTSASTQEITRMVSQVQTDANVADEAMQASVKVMDGISAETGQLHSILSEVTDKVTEVNAQITQIATAAEEQTTATSEISSNMKNITDGSKNLTQELQVVNESISSTHGEIGRLSEIVHMFEI